MAAPEAGASSLKVLGVGIDLKAYLDLLWQASNSNIRPLDALEFLRPRRELPARGSPGSEPARSRLVELDRGVGRQICAARRRVDVTLANRYDSFWLPGTFGRSRARTPYATRTRELDPRRDVRNLIMHAESEDIAVTWGTFPAFLGGFVMRSTKGSLAVRRSRQLHPESINPSDLPKVALADVMVMLNSQQTWVQTFDVLVHELAHVLLGHVGTMRGPSQGRLGIQSGMPLTTAVMEFEVFCAGYLVALVRGGDPTVVRRGLLRHYVELLKQRLLEEVNVLEVFIATEVLCAWCASGPDRSAVLGGRRTGPTGHFPLFADGKVMD